MKEEGSCWIAPSLTLRVSVPASRRKKYRIERSYRLLEIGHPPRSLPIKKELLYPISFENNFPSTEADEYLVDPHIRHLVDFFQDKGLAALALEQQSEQWYQDWIDYQGRHGIYAGLLSPKAYSSKGNQLNLFRLTRFLEVFAYFSPAHAYSLHVSFLGLFPILMSTNEALKREAIAKLENGGVFALGVSERNHGADLLSNEFAVKETGPDAYLAEGSKCYIGNANAASIISILGKKLPPGSSGLAKRAPFAFIALRPSSAPHSRMLTRFERWGYDRRS